MGDDYLYFKFRKIDKHLIESLVNRELYFAKPDTLNDPFDCRLDLRKSFRRAALLASATKARHLRAALKVPNLLEHWFARLSNVGICSFTLCYDDTLLWSHYAGEHKGVCLLYRFSEQFLGDPKNELLGVDKVRYEENSLTEWLRNAPLELSSTDDFVRKLTKIYLTAKSPAWAYEKEARIIRSEPGLFSLPEGCLEQICFGLRTPQADINLVTKLATDSFGPTKFCHMIHDESDFSMRMEAL
ncbi:MAG: DUF2971 domain-containing protein [Candidatus Accumulibacter meliphilus]|jgi:hypothetical protein|uniref:DUF2971 domain-containing protein n=1 Tax=Candidatus Accumulibacter meliphilus TaxID=2211374 RepID=UPI002FC38539